MRVALCCEGAEWMTSEYVFSKSTLLLSKYVFGDVEQSQLCILLNNDIYSC